MPFVEATETVGGLGTEIDGRPAPTSATLLETADAAFRIDNTVGSVMNRGFAAGLYNPDFDVFEAVQSNGMEDDFDAFLGVRNEADFQLRLERVKREKADREILDNAGAGGFVLSTAAAIFDLPSLIPGASLVRGGTRLGAAARVGASAGASAGIAEGALQATQTQRTFEESIFAVGGSVVLGGILGGAFGRSVPADQLSRASTQLERLPTELNIQNKSLSAAAPDDAPNPSGSRTRLRNEGVFQFLRKFPGGYLGDVAEKFGTPGAAVVLEKFAPLAPLTRTTPLIRSQLQRGTAGREIIADLAETPLQYDVNADGVVTSVGGSVEQSAKWRVNSLLNQSLGDIQRSYASYMKDGPVGTIGTLVAPLRGRVAQLSGGQKLTLNQFMEEVGEAMFRGDVHEIKEVRDLAARLRGQIYEPMRREMVEVGFFDELPFKPQFGESYMTRRYRLDQILKNERAVIRRFFDEFKQNQKRAQARIKDLEAQSEPIAASDEHIAGMDDLEIERAVLDTLSSIKGLNPGDSFLTSMLSNPMRARVLDIDDRVLLELGILDTNAGRLTESYVRSVVPRIEMQRKFGNLTLKEQLDRMRDDYTTLRADATSPARRSQLEKEQKAREQDIIGIRDRIMGIYDVPENPDDIWSRAGEGLKSLTYMQLLGMQVTSALPDLAGIPSRAGLREFSAGLAEMATNLPTFKKNATEAAELLSAIEWVGNTRTRALAEINMRYSGGSMAERAIEGATAAFSHATGITAWNTLWKSVANVMVMSRVLKAADALVKGKATKKQRIALAENNISPELAAKMMEAFNAHGQKGNFLWYAKAGNWGPEFRQAFEAGQKAVSRETDIAIVTPGQDKPLWFSTRVGSFFFQLKTFGISANERIVLSGLQRADADVLGQFAMLTALGAAVSTLRADLSGRPRKEGQDLFVDAVDRAGPFQIMFEANAIASAAGFGAQRMIGAELPSRFQSRSSILGAAGPSVDMVVTALEVSRKANSEDGLSSRDVDKITRLLPGQNTPYAMLFRDDLREGVGAALGIDYER